MIIDAFIFFNEIKMLEFRLEEMYDHVDYFVIVESRTTFSGQPKDLYFKKYQHRFNKYLNKIIYIESILPIDINHNNNSITIFNLLNQPYYPNINQIDTQINICSKNNTFIDPWIREYLQRNDISKGLEQLNCKNDDIIIISDVDEIIDVNFLKAIKDRDHSTGLIDTCTSGFSLWLKWYTYNLECVYRHYNNQMVICNYGKLKEIGDCNSLRISGILPIKGVYGWHFSYFGDVDYIKSKITSFAHQEFNSSKFLSNDHIEHKISNKLDLFDRDNNDDSWYYHEVFDIKNYWPKNILLLKQLYNI